MLRPGMLTIPTSILVMASSPYSKSGALWDTYQRNYAKENPRTLVWRADTQTMNPSCDADEIAAAYEQDEIAARAEFGAEFRDDLVGFISESTLNAITVDGRFELPPQPGVTYYGFTDASGGGSDSMTIAIAHREDNTCVLDAMLEVRPPFNTDAVTREFGELARRYGIVRLISDKYALEWVRQRFAEYGVSARSERAAEVDAVFEFPRAGQRRPG